MSLKDAVAQSVLTYEAFCVTPMLVEALKQAGVLQVMQSFPDTCASLLTYNGAVSPEDVLQALDVDDESTVVSTDFPVLAELHQTSQ